MCFFGVGANHAKHTRPWDHRMDLFLHGHQAFQGSRSLPRHREQECLLFLSTGGRASGRNKFDAEFAKTPCKGGNAGLIGDTEERALDCRHGKALFLHVPETLLNVRRYTSMEDLRSPAFCFS